MKTIFAVAVAASLAACSPALPTVAAPPVAAPDSLALDVGAVQLAAGLQSPTWIGSPAGDRRVFVAEQGGRVRVIDAGNVLRPAPFLDITSRVLSGGQRGLLALAFHPRFSENGRFFAYFTDLQGNIRIERFTAGADSASAASARLVISIVQPYSNHTGGGLAFGPDGVLFIGLGDGGSAGDPQGHGQSPATLLGSILRLDVDAESAPYGIPAGNPYTVTGGGRPEAWAVGVQNVTGLSVDPATGILYTADASSTVQEINVAPVAAPGINYGWNAMLGSRCVREGCNPAGFSAPALEIASTDGAPACGIVGGAVYRGTKIPALAGMYLFGDRCNGSLAAFRFVNIGGPGFLLWGTHTPKRTKPGAPDFGQPLSAVGMDGDGEPVVASASGRAFRIVAGGNP